MEKISDSSSESLKSEIMREIGEIDKLSKESILRDIKILQSFIFHEKNFEFKGGIEKVEEKLSNIKLCLEKIFEENKSFGVLVILKSLSLEPLSYEIKGDFGNKIESSEKLAELANAFEKEVNSLRFEHLKDNLESYNSIGMILDFQFF